MAIIDLNKKPYVLDRDESIFIGIDLPFRKSDGSDGYFASTSDAASGVDAHMQKFSLTSFDSDGFTFANTKSGSPGTTHGFTYIIYYLGDMS